jgi:hypothetical protein
VAQALLLHEQAVMLLAQLHVDYRHPLQRQLRHPPGEVFREGEQTNCALDLTLRMNLLTLEHQPLLDESGNFMGTGKAFGTGFELCGIGALKYEGKIAQNPLN